MSKQKKNKGIPVTDKAAAVLFEKIIDTLLFKYEPYRDEMTFEEFCVNLKNESINKRTKKGDINDSDSAGNH